MENNFIFCKKDRTCGGFVLSKKSKKQKGQKKSLKSLYIQTLLITLAILVTFLLVLYGVFVYFVGGLNRKQLDESKLSVNAGLVQESGKITNIALYGLDSRNHDYKGLSDVIMIASINSKTNNVKLISIARDTYVDVPGYGKTKITHAYSYGGAELAIQTLNENFGLNITDYVTANFDSLAEVIDAVGGVDIEVSEAERQQINAYLLAGEPLRETGMVHLNGPQAVSYARIRKIDSDNMRTQRQRNVLEQVFQNAKTISPLQYPALVRQLTPLVETSLSNEEILQLLSVGMTSGLTLEQGAFPNEYIESTGQTIGELWYYVYDVDQAAEMIHDFIYKDIPFSQYGMTEAEREAANAEQTQYDENAEQTQ